MIQASTAWRLGSISEEERRILLGRPQGVCRECLFICVCVGGELVMHAFMYICMFLCVCLYWGSYVCMYVSN